MCRLAIPNAHRMTLGTQTPSGTSFARRAIATGDGVS